MKQPFEQFYPVWSAEKLLDWAYSKARKKSTGISSTMPKLMRIKTKEINRITRAAEYLSQRIERIIKSVPNIDELPIFYRKLSNILVDNDELKRNLGRLNGVLPVLTKLVAKYKKIIKEQQTPKQCSEKRVEFFGRCSSLIRELDDAFKFLEESRQKLLQIPPVNLEMPGVVVAGYPNVGKSTLVGKISTAKPVISSYPFTTKQIFIGMYRDDMGSEYFQVIDTPGILDRPMSKRNNIEKQAILALNTIASVILFVFDPTPTCGYDIDSQIDLYNEIKNVFLEGMTIPVKIIINKVDLATDDEIKYILNKLNTREEYTILINAKDGKNIDKVIDYLLTYFKETNFSR